MSIEITIIRSGLDLNIVSEQLKPEVAQKLISRLADLAWSNAFYEAPWRTGFLAGSIVKDVGVCSWRITVTHSYIIVRAREIARAPEEIEGLLENVCFDPKC